MLGTVASPALSQKSGNGAVVGVETGVPEVMVAIAEAHAALPESFAAIDGRVPGTKRYALNVRITDNADVEHVWLNGLAERDRAQGR